jgi:hypothetical protein
VFRLAYLLLIAGILAWGFQPEANPADAERDKDVYAIYSSLLTNPKTSHGADDNARYLIAASTVPGTPKDPCVRAPARKRSSLRRTP